MMRAAPLLAGLLLAAVAQADDYQDLGHKDWKTRDQATQKLRKGMTEETVKKLEELLKHPELEIAIRSRQLLEPHYEKIAQDTVRKAKKACAGQFPWQDMLPWSDERRFDLSGFLAHDGHPDNAPPKWKNYSDATERAFLTMARQKKDFGPLLEAMKKHQETWIETSGKHYKPPLKAPWQK